MSKYSISILCLILGFGLISAQSNLEEENPNIQQDSVVFQEKYGLRFGVDISRLARTVFESDFSGFELNADYRLSEKLYTAGELGFEEKSTSTSYLDSKAKGNYFKAGIDYNLYENWLGMENLIISGLRFGFSSFSQTRDRYTIYDTNGQTWGGIINDDSKEFAGLTAAWLELIFGIKAELLNNVFLGLNVQIKARLAEQSPSNFENLYIPGFGRTYDSSKIGTGFSYTITYLLPIYKKARIQKLSEDVNEKTSVE